MNIDDWFEDIFKLDDWNEYVLHSIANDELDDILELNGCWTDSVVSIAAMFRKKEWVLVKLCRTKLKYNRSILCTKYYLWSIIFVSGSYLMSICFLLNQMMINQILPTNEHNYSEQHMIDIECFWADLEPLVWVISWTIFAMIGADRKCFKI